MCVATRRHVPNSVELAVFNIKLQFATLHAVNAGTHRPPGRNFPEVAAAALSFFPKLMQGLKHCLRIRG
jgi:hypothetical protein